MKNFLTVAVTLALAVSSAVAAATPHSQAESNLESVHLQRRNHGLLGFAANFVPGGAFVKMGLNALSKRSDGGLLKREVGLTYGIEERNLDLEFD